MPAPDHRDDSALLRQYAEDRSDDAFAALVGRHVNLVYSVAVRCVGNRHQAEEVAQAVFLLLAKKAAQLRHERALSSWLFQATRLTACNHIRSETRRQRREQEAHMQAMLDGPAENPWPKIAPLLDDAVAGLNETDRRAIVLRFYEGRNLRDVGMALGASEDAAEKRVRRAVEKLRAAFARRGVTVGAGGLAVVLSANAAPAAPLGLAATISTAVALSGTTLATGAAATALKTVVMTTLQKTLIATALIAAVGTGLHEARQAAALRTQLQALRQQQAVLQEALQQASNRPPSTVTTAPSLRTDWDSVASDGYRQHLAGLRTAGYPENIIQGIIRADVNRLYAAKMKALRQTAPKYEYWRGEDFIRTGAGRDAWLRMLALNDERDAAMRALGVEPDISKREAKTATATDWMLDYLGEEQKALVLRLHKELDDKLTMREPGSLDVVQIEQAMKDLDDAIKRQLTPAEALQYDLRQQTGTAGRVRQKLGCMEPTEEEFVAVFRIRQGFERQHPELFPEVSTVNPMELTAAQRRAAREATRQVELQIQEQLRTALGPARYADYEMAQIPDYQAAYGLATQAGLSSAEARQLYQARQNAEAQATVLANDPALNADDRRNALTTLRQATEQSLQTVLGVASWEKFGRLSSKGWLDQIDHPPAPNP